MIERSEPEENLNIPTNKENIALDKIFSLSESLFDNIKKVIVGNDDSIEHFLTGILAQGHILLDDVPGVGKTTLARSFARSFDCSFKRVQFTPDLRPTDITGADIFNEEKNEFEFRPGPIFTNILLADEINRAPPKTQTALLEAMEEKQVTVEGRTHNLSRPFIVIATQNSVDREGIYDLPIAQLDRFLKKISLGYPDRRKESDLLKKVTGEHPIESLNPISTKEELLRIMHAVSEVNAEKKIRDYITDISRYTRDNAEVGISPRGSIELLRASRARAILEGRNYVIPDDVKKESKSVLSHRIVSPKPGFKIVKEALENVPVE